MQQPRRFATIMSHSPRAMAGFSLFELVVFIICVAIIYAAAARRFEEFPGEAERANFLAVTAQLQAAINLEMALGVSSGQVGRLRYYEDSNPMDLLLQPPRNYVGSFDAVDRSVLGGRVWYFDRRRNELVYLVNDDSGVAYIVDGGRTPTDEIRFALRLKYRTIDADTGLPVNVPQPDSGDDDSGETTRRISGLMIEPVIPFEWESDIDTAQLSSG